MLKGLYGLATARNTGQSSVRDRQEVVEALAEGASAIPGASGGGTTRERGDAEKVETVWPTGVDRQRSIVTTTGKHFVILTGSGRVAL
jgi:hypothetical protein